VPSGKRHGNDRSKSSQSHDNGMHMHAMWPGRYRRARPGMPVVRDRPYATRAWAVRGCQVGEVLERGPAGGVRVPPASRAAAHADGTGTESSATATTNRTRRLKS
jgi:hypothetical protein